MYTTHCSLSSEQVKVSVVASGFLILVFRLLFQGHSAYAGDQFTAAFSTLDMTHKLLGNNFFRLFVSQEFSFLSFHLRKDRWVYYFL